MRYAALMIFALVLITIAFALTAPDIPSCLSVVAAMLGGGCFGALVVLSWQDATHRG